MNARERGLWRHGHWLHESYEGRYGYWYIVNGERYFYDTPVYPYPLAVATVSYGMPVAAVVAPPPQAVFTPQAQTMRYHCPGVGDAPAVTACPNGWVQVPIH